jgi:uncharacterized Tic20 family protein
MTEFAYIPSEDEAEKASNSYVMSVVAIMAGMPLPIVNLIATLIFWLGNRKGTYFVRWHCTQALLSQFSVLAMNSAGMYWTLSIIFGSNTANNSYFAYLFTIIFFNIMEFIATVYTAIATRKGKHVEWFFYGPLTNAICKS